METTIENKTKEVQQQVNTTKPQEPVTITEGKATIVFQSAEKVFYNHAQEVNRDLSVLVIKMFEQEKKQANSKSMFKLKKKPHCIL